MDLKTQPNEKRCAKIAVTHGLSIPPCCPVSGNPLPGSQLKIFYAPGRFVIEVASLRHYVDSYRGGRGDVRSMEGMIQNIAQDCSDCIGEPVKVTADLILSPDQMMRVECEANPGVRP